MKCTRRGHRVAYMTFLFGRVLRTHVRSLHTRNRNDRSTEAWNRSLIGCHFDLARSSVLSVSIKSLLRKVKVRSSPPPSTHPLHQKLVAQVFSGWVTRERATSYARACVCMCDTLYILRVVRINLTKQVYLLNFLSSF